MRGGKPGNPGADNHEVIGFACVDVECRELAIDATAHWVECGDRAWIVASQPHARRRIRGRVRCGLERGCRRPESRSRARGGHADGDAIQEIAARNAARHTELAVLVEYGHGWTPRRKGD